MSDRNKPREAFSETFADFPEGDLIELLTEETFKKDSNWSIQRKKKVEISRSIVAKDVVYLEYNFKGKVWVEKGIYHDGMMQFLVSKGYSKRIVSDGKSVLLIRQVSNVIEEVIIAQIVDTAKEYVNGFRSPIELEHDGHFLSVSPAFVSEKLNVQSHLLFNNSKLLNLETCDSPFLKDTPTSAFFPYQNFIVEVTANQVITHPYSILKEKDRVIWRNEIIKRNFDPSADYENCHMALFIYNVCNGDKARIKAVTSAIGYLLHRYIFPSRNQVVCVYDEVITSAKEAMGRTGKGVLFSGLRQMRPGVLLDGKKFDENDRFCFQLVELFHALVCLDDPKARLDFKRFFSLTTEGWTIEKKNRQALFIPPAESPKLVILSNTVLNNEGTSNKGRQFVIEFSDHYSSQVKNGNEEPIVAEHGCTFYSDDWESDEWARFDLFMLTCVQFYLENGLVPYDLKNVSANRLRQTAGDDFYEFVTQYDNGNGFVKGQEYDSASLYSAFKSQYQIDEKDMRQRGFTDRLKKFGASKGWQFKRCPGNSNSRFSFERVWEQAMAWEQRK